jgi:hypothetical protein
MPSIGDTLFQFTEWLRTTPLVDIALSIGESRLCIWLQENFFAIPIMQTTHILGLAFGFGAVLMMSLRVLGLNSMNHSMPATIRRYLPWMWWALAALVLSGIGMIIGEPVRELINPIFWIKMVLIVALLIGSIVYYAALARSAARWPATGSGGAGLRIASISLVLLWCATMAGGRWIAYAPT